MFADRVVTLPLLVGPRVSGLPADADGFIPVDRHGRVAGLDDVYAAGEVTSFPLKQGGLAAQQADAVAEVIAARAGAALTPTPFRPVLRGLLMTAGAPLYLRSEPHRAPAQTSVAIDEPDHHHRRATVSAASDQPLWWPPAKIAARYLAPYLATARPTSRAAEPLTVLVVGSFIVAAVVSVTILAITGAMTFIAGRIAGTHISVGLVIAGAIGVWPLALFYAGVTALACGALHGSRTVTGIALAALVAMYAIDLAGRLAHGLEPLRWISAFRYYGAPLRDGIDPASFIGLTAAGVLLLIAGAVLIERRDIHH